VLGVCGRDAFGLLQVRKRTEIELKRMSSALGFGRFVAHALPPMHLCSTHAHPHHWHLRSTFTHALTQLHRAPQGADGPQALLAEEGAEGGDGQDDGAATRAGSVAGDGGGGGCEYGELYLRVIYAGACAAHPALKP